MDSKPTLLVVDDEELLRETIANSFQREGWLVIEAGSVAEALTVLSHHSVDVILSDYSMPGGTGLHLLEEAKRSYPAVPFFLMTGNAGSVGIPPKELSGLFEKPFRTENLLATILGVVSGAA